MQDHTCILGAKYVMSAKHVAGAKHVVSAMHVVGATHAEGPMHVYYGHTGALISLPVHVSCPNGQRRSLAPLDCGHAKLKLDQVHTLHLSCCKPVK